MLGCGVGGLSVAKKGFDALFHGAECRRAQIPAPARRSRGRWPRTAPLRTRPDRPRLGARQRHHAQAWSLRPSGRQQARQPAQAQAVERTSPAMLSMVLSSSTSCGRAQLAAQRALQQLRLAGVLAAVEPGMNGWLFSKVRAGASSMARLASTLMGSAQRGRPDQATRCRGRARQHRDGCVQSLPDRNLRAEAARFDLAADTCSSSPGGGLQRQRGLDQRPRGRDDRTQVQGARPWPPEAGADISIWSPGATCLLNVRSGSARLARR